VDSICRDVIDTELEGVSNEDNEDRRVDEEDLGDHGAKWARSTTEEEDSGRGEEEDLGDHGAKWARSTTEEEDGDRGEEEEERYLRKEGYVPLKNNPEVRPTN
jgi:hypothetical protein